MASNDIHYLREKFPQYVQAVEKNYRHNFLVIALDSAIFTFSMAMLAQDTILPLFVSKLTDNPLFVGLLAAMFFFGNYVPQLLGAYFVQGRRKKGYIITIAVLERIGILLIAIIASLLGKLSNQTALLLFFASYALFTTTLGLMMPAYSDFISKTITKNRGFFYGVMIGLGGFIGFGASLIASRLLDSFAYPRNFQTIFWLGFALSFISPFLMLMFREEELPEREAREPIDVFLKAVPGKIRQNAGFRNYLAIRSLSGLGLMGNSFYALYALQQYQTSSGTVGLFTMLILIAQSIMGFIWGWVGDKFGYKRVLLGMIALMALEGFLAWLNPGLWAFYLIAAAIGGVYAGASVGDPNLIFEIAPPAETSRFVGISNTVLGPIFALAPLLGGLLVKTAGHRILFITIAAIQAALWFVAVLRFQEPRREQRF